LLEVEYLKGGVEARLKFLELSCVGGRGGGAFRFGRGRFGELFDGGGADFVGFGSEVGDGGALVHYFAACFFNLSGSLSNHTTLDNLKFGLILVGTSSNRQDE